MCLLGEVRYCYHWEFHKWLLTATPWTVPESGHDSTGLGKNETPGGHVLTKAQLVECCMTSSNLVSNSHSSPHGLLDFSNVRLSVFCSICGYFTGLWRGSNEITVCRQVNWKYDCKKYSIVSTVFEKAETRVSSLLGL